MNDEIVITSVLYDLPTDINLSTGDVIIFFIVSVLYLTILIIVLDWVVAEELKKTTSGF